MNGLALGTPAGGGVVCSSLVPSVSLGFVSGGGAMLPSAA